MVEGSGLENRQGRKSFVSSNLTHAVSRPAGRQRGQVTVLLAQLRLELADAPSRDVPPVPHLRREQQPDPVPVVPPLLQVLSHQLLDPPFDLAVRQRLKELESLFPFMLYPVRIRKSNQYFRRKNNLCHAP